MNLADVTARIKAIKTGNKPLFSTVLTALDPDVVIEDGIVRQDSAFVVPVREFAAENQRTTGIYSQEITVVFGVMIGLRSVNDRLGSNINERLQAAIKAVRASIVGWEPSTEHEPVALVEGEIVAFMKGGAFWMEQYKTSYLYEQE